MSRNSRKWIGDSHECCILMLTKNPCCCFFSSAWLDSYVVFQRACDDVPPSHIVQELTTQFRLAWLFGDCIYNISVYSSLYVKVFKKDGQTSNKHRLCSSMRMAVADKRRWDSLSWNCMKLGQWCVYFTLRTSDQCFMLRVFSPCATPAAMMFFKHPIRPKRSKSGILITFSSVLYKCALRFDLVSCWCTVDISTFRWAEKAP